jgi:N-methylhydantoinase B
MVSKMVGIHLDQGQRIRLETPGGGGYGNALERDPAAVAEDVRLGYVSVQAAADSYKCSISTDGVLDSKETDRMRRKP